MDEKRDEKLDESHRLPDSFQQIIFNVMVKEKTPERRCRRTLEALIENELANLSEVENNTLTLAQWKERLEHAKANIHIITKGIIFGPQG